jgi:hypothetical protein
MDRAGDAPAPARSSRECAARPIRWQVGVRAAADAAGVARSLPFQDMTRSHTKLEIPKPSDPQTPIEEPPQTPEHVPELPPIHDPDPQQEQI